MPLVRRVQDKDRIDYHSDQYFDLQVKEALKESLPKMEEGQMIAEDALILSDQFFAGNEELGNKFFGVKGSQEKS